MWAEVSAADLPWGSEVRLRTRDTTGPHSCRLVAVGRDGSRQTVTDWSVGPREGRTATVAGAAALRPGRIARFEVRTAAGQRLVTLDAH